MHQGAPGFHSCGSLDGGRGLGLVGCGISEPPSFDRMAVQKQERTASKDFLTRPWSAFHHAD